MSIDKIFENTNNKIPIQFLIVIVAIMLLLSLFILTIVDFDLTKIFSIIKNPQSIKYFFAVFLGFLTSVLATIFTSYLVKTQNENKIQIIKKIAIKELLVDVFNELSFYDNRYALDFEINAKLSKSDIDDMLNMMVDYKYKKLIKSPRLIFHFIRFRGNKPLTLKGSNNLEKEFVMTFDESEVNHVTESEYKVIFCNIRLNNEFMEIPLERQIVGDDVIYNGEISQSKFIPNSIIEFNYRIQCPIQNESFVDFNFDLPTKNIECRFDFKEVKDEIVIGANNIISSHKGPHYFEKGDTTEFHMTYRNWVLPKSSFLFIWWKQ
ncbi:hypothetical protein [uncultured Desulfobacter sp.]|uniref:hypothetical protein n=1 Tax=uncultured Desulfobacter sp. TaxID=240139 RepID=UPI002AAB41D8|nr:hypothetical protein [uncultured Desulfobacter sp.]